MKYDKYFPREKKDKVFGSEEQQDRQITFRMSEEMFLAAEEKAREQRRNFSSYMRNLIAKDLASELTGQHVKESDFFLGVMRAMQKQNPELMEDCIEILSKNTKKTQSKVSEEDSMRL